MLWLYSQFNNDSIEFNIANNYFLYNNCNVYWPIYIAQIESDVRGVVQTFIREEST